MSFTRTVAVLRPRKRHYCDWCEMPIVGPHLYYAGMCDYDFMTMRWCERCVRFNREGHLTEGEKAALTKIDQFKAATT